MEEQAGVWISANMSAPLLKEKSEKHNLWEMNGETKEPDPLARDHETRSPVSMEIRVFKASYRTRSAKRTLFRSLSLDCVYVGVHAAAADEESHTNGTSNMCKKHRILGVSARSEAIGDD
ncbi:hypothetical protein GN956_G5784 [Arapaima gigas]